MSMRRCGTCLHAMFCRDWRPGCTRYRAKDRLTYSERLMLYRYDYDKTERLSKQERGSRRK